MRPRAADGVAQGRSSLLRERQLAERLAAFKPLRGVYGNIDGQDIRTVYPEKLRWVSEGVHVFMTHIGGYPPKYNPAVKKELEADPPKLFICGHSHILKIMYDDRPQCLHMNPGAAGQQGWHKVRTLIRFTVDGGRGVLALDSAPLNLIGEALIGDLVAAADQVEARRHRP